MVLLHDKLIANSAAYRCRHKNVTPPPPLPHRDSDKHWPFLVEVARTLYGNAEFAISSARRFSAPVSKFEESPGKIQSRTNQNIAQVQRIEAERKIRELLNAVSILYLQPRR